MTRFTPNPAETSLLIHQDMAESGASIATGLPMWNYPSL
jgi:hypothetical protein